MGQSVAVLGSDFFAPTSARSYAGTITVNSDSSVGNHCAECRGRLQRDGDRERQSDQWNQQNSCLWQWHHLHCCTAATPLIVAGLGSGGYGVMALRRSLDNAPEHEGWLQVPWPSYAATGRGVHVATGNLDADAFDEIVVGLSTGSDGWIAVLDDRAHNSALLGWVQVPWTQYNTANGEVYPAVGDIDGDGFGEIVAGLGDGSGGWFALLRRSKPGVHVQELAAQLADPTTPVTTRPRTRRWPTWTATAGRTSCWGSGQAARLARDSPCREPRLRDQAVASGELAQLQPAERHDVPGGEL